MGKLVVEKHIQSPVEKVFQTVMDLEQWPETITGIVAVEKLTDGPVANGTKFSETRVMFGKEHSETMTFTDIIENKQYTVVCDSCGTHYESSHTLTAEGDGTMLRMEMSSKPTTVMAKLMSPMSLLMNGSMKKMIRKDFDDIAAACETSDCCGSSCGCDSNGGE